MPFRCPQSCPVMRFCLKKEFEAVDSLHQAQRAVELAEGQELSALFARVEVERHDPSSELLADINPVQLMFDFCNRRLEVAQDTTRQAIIDSPHAIQTCTEVLSNLTEDRLDIARSCSRMACFFAKIQQELFDNQLACGSSSSIVRSKQSEMRGVT